MTIQELNRIKEAVKSCRKESDFVWINGVNFICIWNGHDFLWKAPSRNVYAVTAAEVCEYIGNGDYITDYVLSNAEALKRDKIRRR